MTPGNLDFTIYNGVTFQEHLTWQSPSGTPINLTGLRWRMQIKSDPSNGCGVITYYTLDSENGSNTITVDPTAGSIILTIPATDTVNFNFTGAVYDLKYEDSQNPATVETLIEGKVTISPTATRFT